MSTPMETAIRWHVSGVVPFPVKSDGSKAPAMRTWREHQKAMPDIDTVVEWFTPGRTDGCGVLTGHVSGDLEMLEFEGRAVAEGLWDAYVALCADNGAADVLERVRHGYSEWTPSGGLHLVYRLAGGVPLPNTKLARRPATDAEITASPGDKVKVLIETRGEGGFVVVAPSGGRTHPSGLEWQMAEGGIDTVAAITADERDRLFALATMLDQIPAAATTETGRTGSTVTGGILGTRPGDDYNARATWEEILEPAGWTRLWPMGRGWFWRKPGKSGPGGSATTGQSTDGADRLFVFSTSTEFPSETPVSKFGAYAILHHGGDFRAAAKELARLGYGSQPTQSVLPITDPEPQVDSAPRSVALLVDEQPASTLAKSEDGHSQALIAEYGTEIKYCPERGRWLHWNGSIWQWQSPGGGIVRELSKVIARGYPNGDGWDTFKKRCLSSSGISACLALTETDYRVAVSIHDLDARPWEMNTPGGILDLRTGSLLPSNPRSLHTKTTMCTPDPAADQGVWLAFLADTFNGDAEMIGWLQRLFGYTCVGEVREAILPLFFGLGANGKTTILETVSGLLADYATEAPQGFLVQGPSQHPAEIAELAGARFVIASETNEDQKFDEAKVKQLTGGDRLRGRFMRQDWFSFAPSHTLFLMTNHRPEVRSGGHGFWRRVREVPFSHEVPAHKKIEKYQDVLIREHGPAIMAWLAAGAAQYAAIGLKDPASVRVATSEYQASTDTITRFVEDMCVIGGGEHVKTNSSKVRAAYELWCDQEGETPISSKAMTMQLAVKFGVGKARDMRSRFLTNVSLVASSEDDEERFR